MLLLHALLKNFVPLFPMLNSCPSDLTFFRFLNSNLPEEEMKAMKIHLLECEECMIAFIAVKEMQEQSSMQLIHHYKSPAMHETLQVVDSMPEMDVAALQEMKDSEFIPENAEALQLISDEGNFDALTENEPFDDSAEGIANDSGEEDRE